MVAEANLTKLLDALEAVRKVDSEMPIQTLHTLLLIAASGEEGLMQHELGPKLGLSKAAASRNVSLLSKFKGPNEPGPDFIEAEEVPENRRFKRLRLTSKGERFVDKLKGLVR
jgi:DNA-binding MarR family transcriptional regulator